MFAADEGEEACVQALLRAKANPDHQDKVEATALMLAARAGHEACVQALLRAKANVELLDKDGDTALQYAVCEGQTATAALLRRHASCLSLGLGVALCAALPPTCWPWVALSVLLGAIGTVATRRTLASRPGQHRAALQRTLHRHARHAKAQARTNTDDPSRQHTAPPQPAAAVAPRAKQAAQAQAERAMEEPLVGEEAEQARAKDKSKKKGKAGRATGTGNEPSEAPPPAAPEPPPAAAPKPALAAEERAELALRAAIADGGLSMLKAALAAAPRKVREGGVGVRAQAQCDKLVEAERKAKQEAAAEAAKLAAAERAREEAALAAAASRAREEAVAAVAKADALERAMAASGGGSSGRVAGPSKGSKAAVPDQFVCPITAEIMTDPVNTVRRALSPIASP